MRLSFSSAVMDKSSVVAGSPFCDPTFFMLVLNFSFVVVRDDVDGVVSTEPPGCVVPDRPKDLRLVVVFALRAASRDVWPLSPAACAAANAPDD